MKIKGKHEAMPEMVERKADTTKNGDKVHQCIANQRKREKELYPLRINKTTVIFVKKEKCNEKYAEWYRNRIGVN